MSFLVLFACTCLLCPRGLLCRGDLAPSLQEITPTNQRPLGKNNHHSQSMLVVPTEWQSGRDRAADPEPWRWGGHEDHGSYECGRDRTLREQVYWERYGYHDDEEQEPYGRLYDRPTQRPNGVRSDAERGPRIREFCTIFFQ